MSEFIVCETCYKKSDGASFCGGCLSNSSLIADLHKQVKSLEKVITGLRATNNAIGVQITDLIKNKGPFDD